MSSQRNCIITAWSVESETPSQASRSAEDNLGQSAKLPKKTLGSFFKRVAARTGTISKGQAELKTT